jgi:uncharacterized membrane protein
VTSKSSSGPAKDYEAFVKGIRSGDWRRSRTYDNRTLGWERQDLDARGYEVSEKDMLVVLGASYDSVSDAEVDYEAVKAVYNNAGVGHDFDAAIVERRDDGKVKVAKKHEESTRHGAWTGLAIGALAAILPGIGLVAGAAVGAGIGAVTGHIKGGMSNDDLKQLGTILEKGEAGLIVIYATNMADQVAASIKAENRFVSDAIDADADELAKQLKRVEGE